VVFFAVAVEVEVVAVILLIAAVATTGPARGPTA
jgi:hypothetical protein